MKTTLFYFTGTGNSLQIANNLCEELGDCELIPIAKVFHKDFISVSTEKVGFIFPLHYYGLPKIVHDFLAKLEFNNTNYIFAIITRSGDIDGAALVQVEKILRNKSRTLSAGFFILMPNNFLLLPDDRSEEENNEIIKNSKMDIKKISESIKINQINTKIEFKEGKINFFERTNLKFHKNVYESDKYFFVEETCNSCAICESVCPVDNIILVEGRPQWLHKCQQCLACINFCPKESIQYRKETIGVKRYYHPETTVKDLINQKK